MVTVVVDDLSPQFVKRAGGWKQSSSGYLRHNYWVPARAGKAKRIATWRPTLAAPGDYQVVVKIPSRDATTRKAVYRIKTVDGWVKHRLDQSTAKGKWVDVGTFRLTTTPAVKLTDRTGERASLGRRVGFDAIRFVPVGQPRVSSDPASPADQPPADQLPQAGPVAPTAEPVAEPTPPRIPPAMRRRSRFQSVSPQPSRRRSPQWTRRRSRRLTARRSPRRRRHPSRRRSRCPTPTKEPTPEPTKEPTPAPAVTPAKGPEPSPEPTPEPTPERTPEPTPAPSPESIAQPAAEPSVEPAASPLPG